MRKLRRMLSVGYGKRKTKILTQLVAALKQIAKHIKEE
jgi:hypothetical protein